MNALALWLAIVAAGPQTDLRTAYDVLGYRLAIEVDPTAKRFSGTCFVEARALEASLAKLELDLATPMRARAAHAFDGDLADEPTISGDLALERDGARVRVTLAAPAAAG